MAYKSAYYNIYASLVAALTREGVYVGGTAEYPRVELHSWIENPPQDKGESVRTLTCTMESMSVRSMTEAAQIHADNLAIIGAYTHQDNDFRVVGINKAQMQDLTEQTDSKEELYRILQTLDIIVEQIS